MRVHELAKELKLESKELLKILKDLGVPVKSHASSIEKDVAKTVKELLKEGKKAPPPKKKKEEKPKVVEKAPPPPPKIEVPPKPKGILITTPTLTVKDMADKFKIKSSDVIKELMKRGILATINQRIDLPIVEELARTFNVPIEIKIEAKAELPRPPQVPKVAEEKLKGRPPVVVVLGHVDHGKTKLLDAIRKTKVIETEAGGITQHIGAYQVQIGDKKVTFLDTPGHQAFTQLRARGAKVTDIAVLVVAADDGVMPQTIEALDHARAAKVPILVAINKIDKPEANPDRVKKQLMELGLTPEEWGGDTVMVPISAKEMIGISDLLEMILLVAEMQELKADPDKPVAGIVIEAKLDKTRGPVATVLIKEGTLKVGKAFYSGATYGKVRALITERGEKLREAPPSTPVEILGFSEVPEPGDIFQVVEDEKLARSLAEQKKIVLVAKGKLISLESLSRGIKEGAVKDLNLILKADVQGSLEALEGALRPLSTKEVRVNIIHSGAGAINESDIMLAKASQAIVIGFGVPLNGQLKTLAEAEGVDVRLYNIIYNVTDDIKLAIEGMFEPEYEEVVVGHAEVRTLFKSSKVGVIAGCYVLDGKLIRGAGIRVLREKDVIYEGKLESLKRFKEDVKEVEAGFECGVALPGFQNFKEKDIIEIFEMRVKPRKKA